VIERKNMMRVLLASWGSKGDFYPFLAMARELQRRGHTVLLVGNPSWAETAATHGVPFRASFPEDGEEALARYPELVDRRWLGLPCLHHLMQKAILPVMPSTYAALHEEVPRHDLLVAHHFVFPAAMIAEETGIPWATVCLAPSVTPSAWHRPAATTAMAPRTWLERWGNLIAWRLGSWLIRPLVDRPLNRFRRSLGLRKKSDQFFRARSRHLQLNCYSDHFAPRPADWPDHAVVTGFCFNDFGKDYLPNQILWDFLANGEKPWLFTLGTTVVEHPRRFYQEAVMAIRDTPRRAILLTGKTNLSLAELPSNVLCLHYAPHDWLMPRCAGVVHQCGAGTTAETLRAGVPSVACPFAFDQPNNAALLRDLGVACILESDQHTAQDFRAAMAAMESAAVQKCLSLVSDKIKSDQGTAEACDRLISWAQRGNT
jgi:rhamnosyltransferase subunit B